MRYFAVVITSKSTTIVTMLNDGVPPTMPADDEKFFVVGADLENFEYKVILTADEFFARFPDANTIKSFQYVTES